MGLRVGALALPQAAGSDPKRRVRSEYLAGNIMSQEDA